MIGKCLCGQIEFEILDNISNIYQCHCSLCQKATGTSSCSSIITNIENIKWIQGEEKISSYTKNNGFRTDFCSVFGSPVPNKMNIGEYIWVPAGSLEGPLDRKIVAHIHTHSKATWETESENCLNLANGPEDIDIFASILKEKSEQ